MEGLGIILIAQVIGAILMSIGGIFFLVRAFKVSVVWGLVCLFVPLGTVIFLFKYFDEAATPFAIQLLGVAVALVPFFLLAPAGTSIVPAF